MQLFRIKDHNGAVQIQHAFAEDEDTDNVEELIDNKLKEGICIMHIAYPGTDLWANSFNDPCKVGALPMGIAVEQSCHYFQIIFQTLCFLQVQYSIIGYTVAQLVENY